jgi:hypothetical protein
MTKTRQPYSLEAVMLEAIRILGSRDAAKAANVSAKTLRDYSDPDRAGNIKVHQAIALDKACMAKAGRAPFREAYEVQMQEAA